MPPVELLRGTWFYDTKAGSVPMPVEEALASTVEMDHVALICRLHDEKENEKKQREASAASASSANEPNELHASDSSLHADIAPGSSTSQDATLASSSHSTRTDAFLHTVKVSSGETAIW